MPADTPQAVVEAFERAAVATTTDPTDPPDEFGSLGLGDATVVGLGEASHGSRECHRWRHRLVRHLVETGTARLVILETNFTASLAFDRYVPTGESDPAASLTDHAPWPWQTESMVELLSWLRSFEARAESAADGDRVRVRGCDVQRTTPRAEALLSYLDRVDADLGASVSGATDETDDARSASETPEQTAPDDLRGRLELVRDERFPSYDRGGEAPYVEACRVAGAVAGDLLDAGRERFVARTSRQAFERARWQATLLERSANFFAALADGGRYGEPDPERAEAVRDEAMTDTVAWLVDQFDTDVVVWAHNGHVASDDERSMGGRLAARDGLDYPSVGTALGGGSFRIFSVSDETFHEPSLPDPPAGSLPAAFRRADTGPAIVDLRELPRDGPVADWLASEPARHDLLGGYEDDPVTYAESNLREAFDAVAFLPESSPSRPLS